MAEERLLDRDKDKKYRIRKNEEGEDELYLAEDEELTEGDVAEEEEFVTAFEDDEEMAEMSDEQIQELLQKREEVAQKTAELTQKATACYQAGDYAQTLAYVQEGLDMDFTCSPLQALKVKATFADFKDDLDILQTTAVTQEAELYLEQPEKEDLKAWGEENCQKALSALQAKVEPLQAEVEQKKAERRVPFLAQRRKATINFAISGVLTVILAIATIVFFSQMHSVRNFSLIITSYVMLAVTIVSAGVSVFFARQFASAMDKVKRNEDNHCTKIGRQLIALQLQIEAWQSLADCWQQTQPDQEEAE